VWHDQRGSEGPRRIEAASPERARKAQGHQAIEQIALFATRCPIVDSKPVVPPVRRAYFLRGFPQRPAVVPAARRQAPRITHQRRKTAPSLTAPVIRLLHEGMPLPPFSMKTFPPRAIERERGAVVRQVSNGRHVKLRVAVLSRIDQDSFRQRNGGFAPQTLLGSAMRVSDNISVV